MITIQEFFDVYSVKCPDWMPEKLLDEYWFDCEYTYDSKVHEWVFKDEMRFLVMTFDGELFRLNGYDEEGERVIFEEIITKDRHMIS